MTHLNDLSKVYKEQIAPQETQEEGYKPIDKEKENKMYRRAGNLARTSLSSRGKKKKDAQDKSAKIVSAITRQKEKERFAKMGDERARDNYKEEVEQLNERPYQVMGSSDGKKKEKKIGKPVKSKKYADARAAELEDTHKKSGGKLGMKKTRVQYTEGLDPVGQEDSDIDNDGKKNTRADKYLMNRRKAIGKAMKEEEHKIGGGNLEKLAKKATKRIDADVDGDVDTDDPKSKEMGEFVPSADGKKKVKTEIQKESFSNWRQDLTEVMTDAEVDPKITEKKVQNTIKINPKLGEAVEEIGGSLLEEIEVDEFDYIIESVYNELIEEGYSEDDVEDAIEFALTDELNEVSDRYYDSAVKASKDAAAKKKRKEMMDKAKGRLRYFKRKAGEKYDSAKKKIGMASAKAQVGIYNKGREALQTAGDKRRKAGKAIADAPKKARKGLKGMIRKAAQKVVDRMSEEVIAELNSSVNEQEVPYGARTQGLSLPFKSVDGLIKGSSPAKFPTVDVEKMKRMKQQGLVNKPTSKPSIQMAGYEPEGKMIETEEAIAEMGNPSFDIGGGDARKAIRNQKINKAADAGVPNAAGKAKGPILPGNLRGV